MSFQQHLTEESFTPSQRDFIRAMLGSSALKDPEMLELFAPGAVRKMMDRVSPTMHVKPAKDRVSAIISDLIDWEDRLEVNPQVREIKDIPGGKDFLMAISGLKEVADGQFEGSPENSLLNDIGFQRVKMVLQDNLRVKTNMLEEFREKILEESFRVDYLAQAPYPETMSYFRQLFDVASRFGANQKPQDVMLWQWQPNSDANGDGKRPYKLEEVQADQLLNRDKPQIIFLPGLSTSSPETLLQRRTAAAESDSHILSGLGGDQLLSAEITERPKSIAPDETTPLVAWVFNAIEKSIGQLRRYDHNKPAAQGGYDLVMVTQDSSYDKIERWADILRYNDAMLQDKAAPTPTRVAKLVEKLFRPDYLTPDGQPRSLDEVKQNFRRKIVVGYSAGTVESKYLEAGLREDMKRAHFNDQQIDQAIGEIKAFQFGNIAMLEDKQPKGFSAVAHQLLKDRYSGLNYTNFNQARKINQEKAIATACIGNAVLLVPENPGETFISHLQFDKNNPDGEPDYIEKKSRDAEGHNPITALPQRAIAYRAKNGQHAHDGWELRPDRQHHSAKVVTDLLREFMEHAGVVHNADMDPETHTVRAERTFTQPRSVGQILDNVLGRAEDTTLGQLEKTQKDWRDMVAHLKEASPKKSGLQPG